jgi:redox-sensitive bicupin YhaK (pirin superfamily)
MTIRHVEAVLESRPTIEGAGVHLRRAFGHREVPRLDPFLLLDDFRSENPAEYVAGFPWHPHRGIETVTYMLDGRVDHEDSLGNKGAIGPGDVQWMTAGSGIIHQEMPRLGDGRLGGFQLWVNLPATAKMTDPRYQEVRHATIPEVSLAPGVRARVVAGSVGGADGPVTDLGVDPEFIDLRLDARTDYAKPVAPGHTVFGYVLDGSLSVDAEGNDVVDDGNLVLFRSGPEDQLRLRTRDKKARLLLVSGRPIGEPVAWWGPIVMTNRRELETAVEEYQNGTFIKRGARFGAPTEPSSAPPPPPVSS